MRWSHHSNPQSGLRLGCPLSRPAHIARVLQSAAQEGLSVARIFAGELSRIDQEVLAGVQRLPDDFWVFAEFHVGRNVDWLIIRPIPGRPSVLIMTECKRVS